MKYLCPISWMTFIMISTVFNTALNASHIVGGEMVYSFIQTDANNSTASYDFELIIYRDQEGIDFDPTISIGVFRSIDGQSWRPYESLNDIYLSSIEYIPAPSDVCSQNLLSQKEVESAVYRFQLNLPIIDEYYMVSYQKCCRNHTINNIDEPANTGAVYDVTITPFAQAEQNSSPRFSAYPPTFICLNEEFEYDHSAHDIDGDSLVYRLCKAFVAGGVSPTTPNCCACQTPDPNSCTPPYGNVVYSTEYNEYHPLGMNTPMDIDSQTGIISTTPSQIGAYVVAICIEEYRNDVLISKIRRDFEFNVSPCSPKLEASILADTLVENQFESGVISIINMCEPGNLSIINDTENEQFIQDYQWTVQLENGTFISDTLGRDIRNLDLNIIHAQRHKGIMVINPNSGCPDTTTFIINVGNRLNPDYDKTPDPCDNTIIEFQKSRHFSGDEITNWHWELDGDLIFNQEVLTINLEENLSYQVGLIAQNTLGCIFEKRETLEWDENIHGLAIPEIIRDTIICAQDTLDFFGNSLSESGIFNHIIQSEITGCDSLNVILYLSVAEDTRYQEINKILCPDESIFIDNTWISDSGRYEEIITKQNTTCDSLINYYNIEKYDQAFEINIDTIVCFGESVLINGQFYDRQGHYVITIPYSNSTCDSVLYNVSLEILPDVRTTVIDTIICEDESLEVNDIVYDADVKYIAQHIEYSNYTCDSLLIEWYIEREPTPELSSLSFDINQSIEEKITLDIDGGFERIEWTPVQGLSCSDCKNPVVTLKETQSYVVTIFTTNGCSKSHEVLINVKPYQDFYLPTVMYSGDRSTQNNTLFVQSTFDVSYVYDMFVYDRFGNNLFEVYDATVNDKSSGWQATDLNPGVYVYYINFKENINPQKISGTITIIE